MRRSATHSAGDVFHWSLTVLKLNSTGGIKRTIGTEQRHGRNT